MTLDLVTPRTAWQTPSMSDERMEEMALSAERLAGNVSCYAGGGAIAHELRMIAARIRTEIAPLP
jgi:hypothetical protein